MSQVESSVRVIAVVITTVRELFRSDTKVGLVSCFNLTKVGLIMKVVGLQLCFRLINFDWFRQLIKQVMMMKEVVVLKDGV